MKIYFCDLCNESIPQEDLEKNQVKTVRGKMVCSKCVPAVAPAPAALPAAGGQGGGVLGVLAVVALLVAGAAAWLGWDAKNRLDHAPDLSSRLQPLEATSARILADLGDLTTRAKASDEKLDRLATEPGALRELLGEHLHRIEEGERSLQEVKSLLGSLSSDRELVQNLEIKQEGLRHDLGEVKSGLQALTGKVFELGDGVAAAPGAAPAAAVPPEKGPQLDDETKKLVADLSSKDAGTRWNAVDRLAKKRDATLVPYLLPLLDDPDAFVQFSVISTLRDLNARSAVGRLIKLLRDGDAIVRDLALDALVTLTGNAQKFFAADGTPAEREKGVKLWEEWYEKNKDRFSEPSSS